MNEKRNIPRHVDGRVKVGLMPVKNFFKFLLVAIVGIFLLLNNFNPVTLFITVFVLGITMILLSEFHNKETGIDILKDILKYEMQGDIHCERGCTDEITKKIIHNKIK